MTLAQFEALSKAAVRAERRTLRDDLVNQRAATQYESNDFKAYLGKLEKED